MKKGGRLVLIATPTDFASLTDIVTWIGQFGTWFWTLFSSFATMITTNKILFWLIVSGLVFTGISLVIKVVKKFGLRGRRS